MNHLFFDIECANCKSTCKICEFGYVLTTQDFSVIKRGQITINPDSSFDKYTLKNILHYSRAVYNSSPTYPEVFDEIKSILLAENQLVFGQVPSNDARFLKDESDRYKLDYLDFEFFDIATFYKKLHNLPELLSLDKMLLELGAPQNDNAHIAMADALSAMNVLHLLLEKFNLTIDELIKKVPEAKGRFDFSKQPKKKKKRTA